MARKIGAFKYVECSAKTGYQVANLFDDDIDDLGDEDENDDVPIEISKTIPIDAFMPQRISPLSSAPPSRRPSTAMIAIAAEAPHKKVEIQSLDILERCTGNTAKIQTVTNSLGPAGSRSVTPHHLRVKGRRASDISSIDSESMMTESILERDDFCTADEVGSMTSGGTESLAKVDPEPLVGENNDFQVIHEESNSTADDTDNTEINIAEEFDKTELSKTSHAGTPPKISISSLTPAGETPPTMEDKKVSEFRVTESPKQRKTTAKRKDDSGCQCTIL